MAFPTDWGRRCALIIQAGQVTDNEVNFPLLVTEDTLPSEIFDADGSYPALNGGGDIRFSSDEAGNTQLACEIESFVTDNNPANGKAAIWVKVPSLSSSTNTTIYIWYNKAGESQPAEDNAYGKENVWDSNFVMVQHMNQTPTGSAGEIVDSTSNDNDGTTSGMDSADQVAGQIDGSLDFDGDDDYVDCGSNLDGMSGLTLSAWVKWEGTVRANEESVISNWATSGDRTYLMRWDSQDSLFFVDIQRANNARIGQSYAGTDISDKNLHHIVATYNGSKIFSYLDSVKSSTEGDLTGILDVAINPTYIGTSPHNTVDTFNGTIDEVRISNVARSAGWIATEYNNQNAPGTFLIEGTPETPGVGVTIPIFMQNMRGGFNLMSRGGFIN